MSYSIEKLKKIIEKNNKIVFFGGAGVSTASGIPDFRSKTGLYNRKNNTNFSPEYMLSHEFFINHTDLFQDYVLENLVVDNVLPNEAHKSLKKLEEKGKLLGVITQNIDSLDVLAGTQNIAELHGNLRDYYCIECGKKYNLEYYKENRPCHCKVCGGIVRPDVTLYGEIPPQNEFIKAIEWIQRAEVMIVAGSSLMVYPASGLIDYFKKGCLVLINFDKTNYDYMADIVIHDDIATTLEYVTRDI